MGGELYAAIGHGPRHLDRNIAVVGRVVAGIEHLASLPRGTEGLGFYKERSSDVPIAGVHLASELAGAARPRFEYLKETSASFARVVALPQEPQGRFLYPPSRRRRPVQRAGAGAPCRRIRKTPAPKRDGRSSSSAAKGRPPRPEFASGCDDG